MPQEFRIDKDTKLEQELERLVKHLDPIDVARKLTSKLHRVWNREGEIQYAIPHVLARIMEATCAYARGHPRGLLSEDRYIKLHNLLSQHSHAYLERALDERDVDAIMQQMYREQIAVQPQAQRNALGRLCYLYLASPFRSELDSVVTSTLGISSSQLVFLTIIIYLNASANKATEVHVADHTLVSSRVLDKDVSAKYFTLFSMPIDGIGQRYRDERQRIDRPYLRCMARSGFVDNPLIDTGVNTHLIPFPHLLLDCAMWRPLDEARRKGLSTRAYEDAFSEMCHQCLLTLRSNIVNLDEDESYSSETRCDYVVHLPDCDLAVECKASFRSVQFPIASVLRNSGLAALLVKAHEQLENTPRLLASRGLPWRGILVLPDEILGANSEWFLQNTVVAKGGTNHLKSPYVGPMAIVPVSALETLVDICSRESVSPHQVISEWQSLPYRQVGELEAYLRAKYPRSCLKPLSFLADARDQAIDDLEASYPPSIQGSKGG